MVGALIASESGSLTTILSYLSMYWWREGKRKERLKNLTREKDEAYPFIIPATEAPSLNSTDQFCSSFCLHLTLLVGRRIEVRGVRGS